MEDTPHLSSRYTTFVSRYRIWIIVWWVCGLLFGGVFGPALLSKTVNTFAPPTNSLAGKGNTLFAKEFPDTKGSSDVVIYIYSNNNNNTVLNDAVQQLSLAVNNSVYNFRPHNPSFVKQFQGYYIALGMGLPLNVAESFVSPAKTSTILSLTFNAIYSSPLATDFATYLTKEIKKEWRKILTTHSNLTKDIEWQMLGIPSFITVLQESAERDFALVDGIVMPIALLVLAYIIRSLRLLVIPVCATATSALLTFAIMRFVAQNVDVVSFTPSLMMSILVAMNIDYALFLLSRYKEALFDEGGEGYKAVQIMLASAGHTIMVSGITLASTFLGLVILPIEMLRTLGLGAAIAIVITLLVSMSLTPALLLTFNNFFVKSMEPFTICGRTFSFGEKQSPVSTMSLNTPASEWSPLLQSPSTQSTTLSDEYDDEKSRKSFWYKLGLITLKFPWNVGLILVVVGVTIPFALHAFNYKTSDSMSLTLPNHTPLRDAYLRMCDEFGYGTVYPYKLFMLPPKNSNMSVLSDEFFSVAQNVIAEMAKVPETSIKNFNGLVEGDGIPISYSDIVLPCLNSPPDPDNQICAAVKYARNMFVNGPATSMWVSLVLDWDPIGQHGAEWLKEARAVLKIQEQQTNATFYLLGLPADSMDAIEATYDVFPLMISITAGVVLLFVGIAFRSVLVPLRSVLTVSLTILFVFGFATFTYQYGALNFTHFYGLKSSGAILWLAPIISFSIIVGIGLDYDIFLLTRVCEYRMLGYSTKDSVLRGVHKTGRVITAAGIIMAIAFSGLLFSNIIAMHHLAFYLVFSVLFDTFIVRSLLVPSIMGIFQDWNWWPKKLPAVVKPTVFNQKTSS